MTKIRFKVVSGLGKLKIHIPKVTIDEEEFVRLKLSDFVSSCISSEMLGPGDI